MTWHPDEQTDPAITKYRGIPDEQDSSNERRRWRRFVKWLLPNLRSRSQQADDLLSRFSEGEVRKRETEADKTAAEAVEIAERANNEKLKGVKAINREIEAIFSNNLPADLKLLQLANLKENYPEIFEQLEKLRSIEDNLRLKKGCRLGLEFGEPQSLSADESDSASARKASGSQ